MKKRREPEFPAAELEMEPTGLPGGPFASACGLNVIRRDLCLLKLPSARHVLAYSFKLLVIV